MSATNTNDQRKDQQLPVEERAGLSSMPWWVWIIAGALLFALSYCAGYISRPRTEATTRNAGSPTIELTRNASGAADPTTAAPGTAGQLTPLAEPTNITMASPTHTPPASYPLAGQIYPSNRAVGEYDPYVAVWSRTGWLHQPNLPPEGQREPFVIAITIEEGRYVFWGVSCDFWLDDQRTGSGAKGKPTLGRGNNIPFVVKTRDGGQAWATVVCKDDHLGGTNEVVGFSIQYLGTLP